MKSLSLTIDGMSCGHCVGAVRRALEQLTAVEVDSVDIGHASVRYDPGALGPERVLAAVRDAGYQVTAAHPGDPSAE
jgi:copper chaperone CopZ